MSGLILMLAGGLIGYLFGWQGIVAFVVGCACIMIIVELDDRKRGF